MTVQTSKNIGRGWGGVIVLAGTFCFMVFIELIFFSIFKSHSWPTILSIVPATFFTLIFILAFGFLVMVLDVYLTRKKDKPE